jgi:hypothetical protein
MLKKVNNPHTGRSEYALVSVKDPGKVLKYFGAEKPSEEHVRKEEARVEWFKHKKG